MAATACSATKNFLADNGSGTPLTALSFLIETVGTTASNRPPDHLVLVMYSPVRTLRIPIDS